jgi:hypothetical protein
MQNKEEGDDQAFLAAAEKSTLKLFSSQLSSRDAEIYIIM